MQNLFFATLNTEIGDREFAVEGSRAENEEHFGVKIFYRYASEFAVSEEEVIKLFRSIPFMNGGLFECLDRDNHYYDGFSRRKSKRAQVPNALFFDDKGLIPLLSQYNFTVEENSPGDEEVALDPEMLGKVFENLLGAYNPETQVAARNATGSFYTPREIVNYMVDESLIAHLTTKCGEENEAAIRKLFADGERPADATLCEALDESLVTTKILDPACGSGAFPMGILLRMVEVLRILREIPEDENVYDLKLELIENCIYGGDIQCIAVQITKLRFFISLVCEEGNTGISACGKGNTGISACAAETQTGMSVLPSYSITRRNLPHWKKDGAIYWITFRLADSIPQDKLKVWKEEFGLWLSHNPKPWDEGQWKEYDKRFGDPFEKWLDAGTGSCALGRPDVREALVSCLLKFNQQRLFLHSAVIMPNHVHCLMELANGEDLSKILKGIKGASARAANKILGIDGKFWMDESYDHIVRSPEQYAHFIRYIEENPKKAGLNNERYWLHKGNTDIPVCVGSQAGMPVLPCAENNYGIHTLPNLETKFVAADSLIGLPKSGDALPMANVELLKKELWDVRHKHFRARSYREKKELRKEDRKLRTALAKELRLGGGFDTASAKLMAKWDPYDQNASAAFSDPEWMFNVKDGFDVVIGNPPYVQLQANEGSLANLYENEGYTTFGRTADVYCLFYEQGLNVLRTLGHLCYITSNQWMRTAYGKKLRTLFSEQARPIKLLDMGEGVFEATTNTNVLLIEKNKAIHEFPAVAVTDRVSLTSSSALQWIMLIPSGEPWVVTSATEQMIMSKMRAAGTPLKNWDIEINYGVKTGFNAGFIADGVTRDHLVKADKNNREIIKPLLEGKNIKRYRVVSEDLWLINTHNGYKGVAAIDINDYPSVKAHLDAVEKQRASGVLGEKAKKQKGLLRRDDQGKTPYNLRNCAYVPEFEKEKITWGNLCLSAQFTLVDAGVYINAPAPLITPASRYLLAVLNSKLGDYFIRCLGVIRSGGYFEYKPMFVEQLPVPIISEAEQKPFAKIVDRILVAKKTDPTADTSALEAEIDELVYNLYGLTEEEKAIVKGSTGILACEKRKQTQTGMSVSPSKRKRKTQLPDSLPGWD